MQAVLARRTCMLAARERTLHKHSRLALLCFLIAPQHVRHASTSKACAACRRRSSALTRKHAPVIIWANQAQPAGHPCSHLLRHVCERIAQPTKVACRVLVRGDLTSLIMSYGVEFSRGAPMGICAWCLAISATSIPSAVDIASCGSSGVEAL